MSISKGKPSMLAHNLDLEVRGGFFPSPKHAD